MQTVLQTIGFDPSKPTPPASRSASPVPAEVIAAPKAGPALDGTGASAVGASVAAAAATASTTATATSAAAVEEGRAPSTPGVDVPDGSVLVPYTVEQGDTASGLAMRFRMTSRQFSRVNKLYGSAVFLGQVVYVVVPKEHAAKHLESASAALASAKATSTRAKAASLARSPSGDALEDPDAGRSSSQASVESPPRRKSQLGGQFFEPVVVADGLIKAEGVLELNRYYMSFSSERFVSGFHRDTPEAKDLLAQYAFRLDWRDVDGCSAAERPSSPAAPAGAAADSALAAAAAAAA